MTDHTDLIKGLEAADGPSREMDAEIAGTDPATVIWHDEFETPHYTSSVDAALTLRPEGWDLDLKIGGELSHCVLTHALGVTTCGWNKKTPALAICIAALKAQEQTK